MCIFTVRAFADFDIPYTVNIGVFNSIIRVNSLRDRLNEWVNQHPKVNNDIRISEILENEKYKNEFIEICRSVLFSAIPMSDILSFVETCFDIFEKNYVYLNTDIFGIDEIKIIC